MKKLLMLLIAILTYTNGFCSSSSSIDSLANEINSTCPIKWEYNCVIKSLEFTGFTVAVKIDYDNVNGDFFTKFRDNARNNRQEWIATLYKISPKWQQLFDECDANSITFTLIIFSSSGGGFSIKVFPEQIRKMKAETSNVV